MLKEILQEEIQQYTTEMIQVGESFYSAFRLIKRISMFENKIYPTGKVDSQGNYKFWFDIQSARVSAEVKNIDFDTKDIEAYSTRLVDTLPNLIVNLKLKEYLRNNGQAEEINSSIEEGSAWGNVLWKKIKGGYERCDLKNTYVINQSACDVKESPVVERHEFSADDLARRRGSWKNLAEALTCSSFSTSQTLDSTPVKSTVPYYEIYERNGLVKLSDLKMENKEEEVLDGDDSKFVLAKVIGVGKKGAGTSVSIEYILFAQQISEMPYEEYHRGPYKGRWFREGIIEILMDSQVRANQIGNQIAQGLEWASKTIFTTPDKLIAQNVVTDMKNGDIIRAGGLTQVAVRMEGFDQLVADWNRIIVHANELCNSQEIIQGQSLPSGTPFRLGALLNQNANKLFDFLREKLAIPYTIMFERWIVPQLVSELKAKDILRITGDSRMLERLIGVIVDGWYIDNLLNLPPHSQEAANSLKQLKIEELKKRPQLMMSELTSLFDGYKASVCIVITGENSRKAERLESYATFIQLEADPVRRTAMIEDAMKLQGIDVGAFPKAPEKAALPLTGISGGNGSQGAAILPKGPVSAGVGAAQ